MSYCGERTGSVTLLVKCLPGIHKALHKLNIVVHACDPSTWGWTQQDYKAKATSGYVSNRHEALSLN